MDADQETWRAVVGWEGFYEVSDFGRVRSIRRQTSTGMRGGIVRKLVPDEMGRLGLSLMSGVHGKAMRRVHILVAEAFLGPRPEGAEVCHWDGDVTNNALSNLRYDTHSANERDKRRHGTHHNSVKTHCPQGHPYDEVNTYINPKGSRECFVCKRRSRNGRATEETLLAVSK